MSLKRMRNNVGGAAPGWGAIAQEAARVGARHWAAKGASPAFVAFNDWLQSDGRKPAGILKPVPISQAIKNTKLKSYLDKTYAKRCGVEVKHYQAAGGLVTNTTLLNSVNFPQTLLIPQNTTDTGRIGDTIEIKEVQMNFSFSSGVASARDTRVRMFLVKTGQTAPGLVPVVTDILWDSTNIRSGVKDKREHTGLTTFTILKEWNFTLQPPGVAGIDTKYMNFTYRPKGCHSITWTDADTTGDAVNVIDGHLCLYTMYENVAGPVPPVITLWQEFSFVDL